MEANVRRVCLFLLVGFALVAARLGFLAVVRGASLAAHPRNPRLAEARRSIQRGGIYLRGAEVVARDAGPGGPRVYTGPASLAHLVGYEDPKYGTAGLEAAYNAALLGLEPRVSVRSALRRLALGEGRRGCDLVLSVDLGVQRAAERAMAGRRGAVVALDPRTGAVLAILSNPGFDPNRISSDWDRLAAAPAPLFNRATLGLYPPGSTIKPLIAAVALRAGAVRADEAFECAGTIPVASGGREADAREISCPSGASHGLVRLSDAIALSCNVAFAQVGWKLGPARLYNGLREFGFGQALPFDVAATAGRAPSVRDLDRAAVAQIAIGQGELVTSPLHMAVAIGAIANGGSMLRPFAVSEVRSPSGAVWRARPAALGRPVPRDVARAVVDMMVEAVTRGTARSAAIPGVRVAGKTGTAQNPHGAPHAWFAGFAPADDPQVVVVVVVENGGSGGAVAGPVGREVMRAALQDAPG